MSKITGKRTKKPQNQQKERNHNIRAELSEKEMKEMILKINKLKAGSLRRLTKLTKLLTRLIKKKERRIKSTKLELKKDKLQQTMQKYRGL